MRFSTTQPLRFHTIIVVGFTVLAALANPMAVHADGLGSHTTGDIRLGLFYLTDTGTRNNITSTIPAAGLDVTISQSPGTYRTNIGVDYIDRNSGGTQLQEIPVTISEQYYHTIGSTSFAPYGEAGLGVYFVQLSEANNASLQSTHSETSVGGFIGAGLDLSSSLFLDVRYHLVGNIEGQNPSGIEFTAGLRF